jgi:membrane protease YdiL (CAAX protease family)
VGVFLQATLFAIAHAQQGAAAIVRVGFYGLLFGALAQWRGSLLPGMMCHVAIDVVGGM